MRKIVIENAKNMHDNMQAFWRNMQHGSTDMRNEKQHLFENCYLDTSKITFFS